MPDTARYARWKAPADDGATLIWPAPADLLRETRDNQRRLSSATTVRIQGVPLPELRSRLLAVLGFDPSRPVIATGHQAELHHPGVWVKNILIDEIAVRVDGRAVHFAVDTDAPKHLLLRWPGGAVPLVDVEVAKKDWSGLVPAPSPGHLQEIAGAFADACRSWNFNPLVPQFLTSMQKLAPQSANLPDALTRAIHELDQSLGLRHDAMLMSPICVSEPYLVFVHHILSRADAFAADYNSALDEFRQENKIRTPGRPMPNLKCLPEGCETPFWLDDLSTGTRTRAAVARDEAGFSLRLPNRERFPLDPNADGWTAAEKLKQFLQTHNTRLSPRALTLTAVLRLLVADQFVHGIGGAQYDQVLDKLIARHFHFDPPRFSVTTATLFFPSAVGQSRVCLPCVAQEGHRLKHSLLGQEKLQLVEAIAGAPRNSMRRAELFSALHSRLDAARAASAFREWEQRFAQTQQREQEEKVLFDRELFYAIQPRERLTKMIQTYRDAVRG